MIEHVYTEADGQRLVTLLNEMRKGLPVELCILYRVNMTPKVDTESLQWEITSAEWRFFNGRDDSEEDLDAFGPAHPTLMDALEFQVNFWRRFKD